VLEELDVVLVEVAAPSPPWPPPEELELVDELVLLSSPQPGATKAAAATSAASAADIETLPENPTATLLRMPLPSVVAAAAAIVVWEPPMGARLSSRS